MPSLGLLFRPTMHPIICQDQSRDSYFSILLFLHTPSLEVPVFQNRLIQVPRNGNPFLARIGEIGHLE